MNADNTRITRGSRVLAAAALALGLGLPLAFASPAAAVDLPVISTEIDLSDVPPNCVISDLGEDFQSPWCGLTGVGIYF